MFNDEIWRKLISSQVTYLGSNISSTESDVKIHIGKARTAIERLPTIWKYDLFDKIKQEFFRTEIIRPVYIPW